ncbi:hypothetical protein NQ317_016162 [Molorchus minor]|uniref:Uncharacterized protein n=1 Tax=Molorchus minor TaxID=1323400 RepID=A0ABQ9IXR1_9CUCU|nr:hypothetical protein NQ317_016162 [Molorchus minor]
MENSSVDEQSKSSRHDSIKELGTSQASLKKNSIHFKSELTQEIDNQKQIHDASLKVPHKIIANWRSACDRTKDKTKDLRKRLEDALPEIEAENIIKKLIALTRAKVNMMVADGVYTLDHLGFMVNEVAYVHKGGMAI